MLKTLASKMLKTKSNLLKQEAVLLLCLADTYTQIYIYLLVNSYIRLSPRDAGTVQNTVLIYMLCRRT